MNGHTAAVAFFLIHSAKVDVWDKDGLTPLQKAALHGNKAVLGELLSYDGNVKLKTSLEECLGECYLLKYLPKEIVQKIAHCLSIYDKRKLLTIRDKTGKSGGNYLKKKTPSKSR